MCMEQRSILSFRYPQTPCSLSKSISKAILFIKSSSKSWSHLPTFLPVLLFDTSILCSYMLLKVSTKTLRPNQFWHQSKVHSISHLLNIWVYLLVMVLVGINTICKASLFVTFLAVLSANLFPIICFVFPDWCALQCMTATLIGFWTACIHCKISSLYLMLVPWEDNDPLSFHGIPWTSTTPKAFWIHPNIHFLFLA